jgi:CRP/FNR family transcriptional regulator
MTQHSRIADILKAIYLFRFMSEEEIEKLCAISSIHRYDKGSCLFMKGEVSEHLLILIEGSVTVYKHDEKGNEIIIGLFSPFSLLAEPAILKHLPFPSTATFGSEGAVIKIKLDRFEEHFLRDPHVSYEIIQSLLEKIQLLQENIHMNIASTAQEKILNYYKKNSDSGTKLKNYQIASLLGMSAETFSRKLTQLIREGKLLKTETGYKLP